MPNRHPCSHEPPDSSKVDDTSALPSSASQGGSASVRVLCVEDHAVLVEGLKAQFGIDGRIEVVGQIPSADRVLEEVARLKPDIVMFDIEMPGSDVFEMADRLRHLHPNLRFVFLSAYVRDGYLAAAYKCGAWGYFSKGDDLSDIVAGIMSVARSPTATFVMGRKVREICLPRGTHREPGHTVAELKPSGRLDALTQREIEVLRLIGKGKSRHEIAAELSRSVKTIDGHQDRIMKKLNIETRADLLRFAIREGLAEA